VYKHLLECVYSVRENHPLIGVWARKVGGFYDAQQKRVLGRKTTPGPRG